MGETWKNPFDNDRDTLIGFSSEGATVIRIQHDGGECFATVMHDGEAIVLVRENSTGAVLLRLGQILGALYMARCGDEAQARATARGEKT